MNRAIMPSDHGHQWYLSSNKNPNGYCGLGVSCPVGVAPAE
ncbi:hypothetical protein SAMN04489712_104310 [Thermomonospora echinospora]|uniref:Uncharacterized protein n=1 Tax=Thermomonospora echinospora TaxID=1992 RepID=A0A1H5Z4D1_9ACTN|nr:hypothetical protein SAMN04489712_104310 [Thermomonospora echinospora]